MRRAAIVPVAWIAVLGVLSSSAQAQCSAPTWSSMGQQPGLNGPCHAFAQWDPDGPGPAPVGLAVGGWFSAAGTVDVANNVAFWDGTSFHPLGAGFDAAVSALAVYNGELIAGGEFTMSGTVPVSRIARWNGTAWQPLGVGILGSVRGLAVHNGELIAGGNFSFAGGASANNVARWNGSTWNVLGTGIAGSSPFADPVSALMVYNGDLIAGGLFVGAGGVGASNVARWNGTSWAPLGGGVASAVYTLTNYGGNLVSGGSGGVSGWNGTSWSSVGPAVGATVYSLGVHNTDLIAGGNFTSPAFHVARWNGTAWAAIGNAPNGEVRAVTSFGGNIVVGVTYGVPVGLGVAQWSGTQWVPLCGMSASISAMIESGGDLVVGGYFVTAGGMSANHVARWDGGQWQPMGPGLGVGTDSVSALTTYNGNLVAGGGFTSSGATPVNRIASWNGSNWIGLGSGMDGPVFALGVYNGDLIAGGAFTTAGGVSASNIARWNGSSWQPLGSGTNAYVFAFAVYNGDLVAGGSFTTAGGVPAARIARWNGASWQPLGTGISGGPPNVGVSALAVYGGELIACGGFSNAGGIIATNIARWNGTAWQSFGSGLTGPIGPSAMAVTAYGGFLVVAGLFAMADGVPASNIAQWNGTTWQSLGLGVSGWVDGLATYRGSLMVGGAFAAAGGFASSAIIARWSQPLPMIGFGQPSGAGTGVVVANHWLVPGHEYYDVFSLDLAPGGPGTGPYGGLWFSNPATLLQQLLFPIGTTPFHFIATGADATFGPYPLPPGLAFEALSGDVTGGVIGCISTVGSHAVY